MPRRVVVELTECFGRVPSEHRLSSLKALLHKCSTAELSELSDLIAKMLRVDFVKEYPVEVAMRIFQFLDATSLCHAAQCSRSWRKAADDDLIWHRMCEQHIDKKCAKCGWGLPLLDRKRKAETSEEDGQTSKGESLKSWKHVYSERLLVERNWRRGNYRTFQFKGHTDGIMSVQYDECLSMLVSGSYDHTIKVWNTETKECIKTLIGHSRCVRAVQFDEHKIISGSLDRTLRIWNMKTFDCIRVLEGHNDGVVCLHFDDKILASGSADATIRVWNISTGKCFVLKGHSDWVNQLEIYRKKFLFSCSDDHTVRLWDLQSKQQLRCFTGHNDQVQSLHISLPHMRNPLRASSESKGGEAKLVTASLDKTVKIWSIENGECLKTLFGHEEGVWCVSSDTLRIVSGSNDRKVILWDLESGSPMYTFKEGHTQSVSCCYLTDTKIVTGAEDGVICMFDFGVFK
ncbi:WD40-repeat-containing domain protein [Chytridium lagenaria]|nr:WD40-repeat-containing domain protein [Chytridium lagenaria]